MPLTPTSVTTAILSAGPTLQGADWYALASATGTAIATWAVIPANVSLTGLVSGTAGSGVVTGKVFISPVPLPVSAAFASVGLLGLDAQAVAQAIGVGVAAAINTTASYVGVSVGAIGPDVSKVTLSNPGTLIPILSSSYAALGLVGLDAQAIAVGVGNGVAAMVLTGSGTGIATGAGSGLPGTGTSTSTLL